MRRYQSAVWLIAFFMVACTTISTKGRMEKFTRLSEAYEHRLLDADYRGASKFIHASAKQPPLDEKHYANIKIVEYNITNMDVSADKLEIKQDLELKYFLLNNNRLRTTRHHQVWRYSKAEKIWQLHTGLPGF